MRRPERSRLCATLLALWVPVVLGLAGIVPRCAQHQGTRHHAPATAQAHHQHGEEAPTEESSHSCSCIGGCTVSRTEAIAPALAHVPAVVATLIVAPAESAWSPAADDDREFSHYATGPPKQVA